MGVVKPILFNTEMVRAIQDGRKTVTRRVIKPQPESRISYVAGGYKAGSWGYPSKNAWEMWGEEFRVPETISDIEVCRRWTPPCHGDDILWVRETWNYGYVYDSSKEAPYEGDGCRRWFEPLYDEDKKASEHLRTIGAYFYRADMTKAEEKAIDMIWRPSIHMPKEVARIFLRVKKVRVERLQDIQERGPGSAVAEGFGNDINPSEGIGKSAAKHFADMWDSTIKKAELPYYGWEANPWVWVIDFERVDRSVFSHL